MKTFMSIATLSLMAACASTQAYAQQPNCAPHEVAVQTLKNKHGESLRSIGVDTGGSVVETYASSTTGSWTIIVTNPEGVSCMKAAGEAFVQFQPEAEGEDT